MILPDDSATTAAAVVLVSDIAVLDLATLGFWHGSPDPAVFATVTLPTFGTTNGADDDWMPTLMPPLEYAEARTRIIAIPPTGNVHVPAAVADVTELPDGYGAPLTAT